MRTTLLVLTLIIIVVCGCARLDMQAPTDMISEVAKSNAEHNRDAAITALRVSFGLALIPAGPAAIIPKPFIEFLLFRYSAKKAATPDGD